MTWRQGWRSRHGHTDIQQRCRRQPDRRQQLERPRSAGRGRQRADHQSGPYTFTLDEAAGPSTITITIALDAGTLEPVGSIFGSVISAGDGVFQFEGGTLDSVTWFGAQAGILPNRRGAGRMVTPCCIRGARGLFFRVVMSGRYWHHADTPPPYPGRHVREATSEHGRTRRRAGVQPLLEISP